MKKKITPRALRRAQTYLAAHTYMNPRCASLRREGDEEYMCWAFTTAQGSGESKERVAFESLLREAGVPTLSGGLGMRAHRYRETAQPVRFMLLGFMALYLEDLAKENTNGNLDAT